MFQVVQTLLKRTDLNIKGNVTLKRRAIVPTAKPDDPAQLLQRLFQSWNSQNTADISKLIFRFYFHRGNRAAVLFYVTSIFS